MERKFIRFSSLTFPALFGNFLAFCREIRAIAFLLGVIGFANGAEAQINQYLPFDMPSSASLRASPKKVFAHYFVPYPLALDSNNSWSDYYVNHYLVARGESNKYLGVGGFLHERPLGRPARVGTDWKEQDVRAEVQSAIAVGLDGFTINLMAAERHQVSAERMLAAANAVDPGFKIVLMPDMDSISATTDVQLTTIITRMAKQPACYHLGDGRLVVSPFNAENHPATWWKTWMDKMAAPPINLRIALIPVVQGWREHSAAFQLISYGISDWGDRNALTNANALWSGSAADAHEDGYQIWMHPVAPQDSRPKAGTLTSPPTYQESANTALFRNGWEAGAIGKADWVQMITWNDYSESSEIAPSTGTQHLFYDLTAYYVSWFKNNAAPAVLRDCIYYSHRQQSTAAVFDTTKQTVGPYKLLSGAPKNEIEAYVFLTANATLEILVNGVVVKTQAVSAPRAVVSVPLSEGTPSFRLLRGSAVVAAVQSPFPISNTIDYQNFLYHGGSSLRAPVQQFTSVATEWPTFPGPTSVIATAGSGQAGVTWTALFGATSYNLKRATVSGGPYLTVATGLAGTSFLNTGLSNGTPYYYVVSAISAGSETANSNQVAVTPVGAANVPPLVAITSPLAAAIFTAPASVVINATASDSNGTVSKVEFFQGAAKLGEDLTAPYSFTWNSVAAGTYGLTAKATDNAGATTTSASVNITVRAPNVPPVIAITSPLATASFTAPASVLVNVTASDSDGTVSKVEFFQGATKLGEDLTAPYSFTWNGVAAGAYSLTVKATDNVGATTTSAPVSIAVRAPNVPPVVTLTSPLATASFTAPASVLISATASDSDGTVSKVEFFQGATKLGEDLTAPYNFTWNGVAAGTYALTAKATDNAGATTTSASMNITVRAPNVPPVIAITSPLATASFTAPASVLVNVTASDSDGTVSKVEFFQGATKLGESLAAPYSFTWNGVAAGTYALTAKATDNVGATITSAPVSITVRVPNVPPVIALTSPLATASFTAPASVLINATASDSDGTVSKVEFFQGATKLGESLAAPYNFTWNGVAAGTYSLTVKATDNVGATTTSAPVSITVRVPNVPPVIALTSPLATASFTAPASVLINATATDSDGTVSKVEFFQGATKLGESLAAPYNFAWNSVAAGTYALTAKATDNVGATTTSAPVSITVKVPNVPPVIALTSPLATASFTAPASVLINATATDSDGTVSKVEFFQGATKLGESLAAPYNFTWNGVAAGTYSLTVKATDNVGATTTSAAVSITVKVPNVPPVIVLTSPLATASFTAPASVLINATATDIDGTVSKVEFFQGATKLGESLAAPYNFAWNSVAAGTYALTAKATDNVGATTTSAPVSITVRVPNVPPVVALTSPLATASFTAPASVLINATATDSDGTVSKVEFFQGATKLGESLAAPYNFTWNGVAAGTYTLTAKATDNVGATTTSASVSFTVKAPNVAPVVSITSPGAAASFSAPASILITATASDSDGTVSKVEFFQGATKLGESLSPPYSFTWTSVATGTYSLSAKATDNSGATTTSVPVLGSIVFQETQINRYLPFDMPSTASLRASPKKAFAHYAVPFPVSFENNDPSVDYYTRQYLTAYGEANKHLAYGGFLHERPLGRLARSGTDWREQDLRAEVQSAIAVGLDGFTVDLLKSETYQLGAERLLAAANVVDPGFKIVLMPDMESINDASDATLTNVITRMAAQPACYHLADGRLVVSPFNAQNHSAAWWKAWLDKMAAAPINLQIAFVPVFQNWRSYSAEFQSISYGISDWGDRNVVSNTYSSWTNAAADAHAAGYGVWMHPVAPQDSRPRSLIYQESDNTALFRNGWESGAIGQAEWVQLLTWNGYSEHAAIAPSTGTQHLFYDLTAYYVSWFKNNAAPAVLRDCIYYTHRQQSTTALPDPTKQTAGLYKIGSGAAVNEVEAYVFLTADATLEILVNGVVVKSQAVSAPRAVVRVPLTEGTPSFRILRGGAVVAAVQSAFPINNTIDYQNFLYHGGTSLRLPVQQYSSYGAEWPTLDAPAGATAAVGNELAPTVALQVSIDSSDGWPVAPALLQLSAMASNPDGAIRKVEFYQGSSKIGEVLAPPYTLEWANVPAGSYLLTAKAISNDRTTPVSAGYPLVLADSTRIAGSYNGLVKTDPGFDFALTGSVRLNVAASGRFTGVLSVGGSRLPIRGMLTADGRVTTTVSRRRLLDGQLIKETLSLHLTCTPAGILGALRSDGPDLGGQTALIESRRGIFNAKNPAPQAGRYTAVMPYAELQSLVAGQAVPGLGHGYALVTVSKTGVVRLSGALGDGTGWSSGGRLDSQGRWPLFVSLYAGTGLLQGVLEQKSDGEPMLSGTGVWFKPALNGTLERASRPALLARLTWTGDFFNPRRLSKEYLRAAEPGFGFSAGWDQPGSRLALQWGGSNLLIRSFGSTVERGLSADGLGPIAQFSATINSATGLVSGQCKRTSSSLEPAPIAQPFRGIVLQHRHAVYGSQSATASTRQPFGISSE